MKFTNAATDEDVENVEAWSVLIEHVLHQVPSDLRSEVLRLALENETAARKQRETHELFARPFNLDAWEKSPCARHWNTIMRLKGLVVQVLVRGVTNNHSPEGAAGILFAYQRHGSGGRQLRDYLDRLPGYGEPQQ